MSNGKEKARCKQCEMFLGKDGNSTLMSYTTKTCPVVKGQGDPDQQNITPDGSIFIYNNDEIRESFCKFMIQEVFPFNHFDNLQLTRILQEKMQPQYRQVSHTYLRRDALKYWDIAKKDMQLLSQKLSYRHDTLDRSLYLGMNKRVAFELFVYPHMGTQLFAILVSVIETYNLHDKIFSISFDNASNNIAAAKRLIAKYKPILDGSFFHTRCLCHIINLAVKDGLKMIGSTIEIFKIVLTRVLGKIKATLKKYRKFAISINVNPYSPHWDVDTRSSSTCMIFESLTRQRIDLQLFYDTISKGKNPVLDFDWELMGEFVEMLKVSKQSTTFLSGMYYPTSPLLLNELWLKSAQLELFEQRSEIFFLVTRPMRQKLVKYFNEMPPLFTGIAELNPCINVTGVETLITKIYMSLNLHKDDSNYIHNQIHTFNNTFTNRPSFHGLLGFGGMYILHLASLEGPLAQNVEPEIVDEEYAQGLSTPPEDEDEDDEYGIDETPNYLCGG
ncbi:hypothetical protein Lser_V15G05806 [Lactuca serriola]